MSDHAIEDSEVDILSPTTKNVGSFDDTIPVPEISLRSYHPESEQKLFGEILNQLNDENSQASQISAASHKKSVLKSKIESYK